VRWYNIDHRHREIRYVSPAQRHVGDDQAILAARHAVYTTGRELIPACWTGATGNWLPTGSVSIYPDRDRVIEIAFDR